MKAKTKIRMIILCVSLLVLLPSSLFQVTQGEELSLPILDVLDLKVDGSGSGGVNVSTVLEFSVIMRLVIRIEFTSVTLNLNEFGSGSSLANGTSVFIIDVGLEVELTPQKLKTNDDFGQFGYDVSFFSDEQNPKDWLMLTRFSFFKIAPNGLDNRTGRINEFFFQVNDDLTNGDTTHFTVAVEGYRIYGSSDSETQTIIVDKRTLFGVITPELMFMITLLSLFVVSAYIVYSVLLKDD